MNFTGLYRTRNALIVDAGKYTYDEIGNNLFDRELDLIERIPPGDEPLVTNAPSKKEKP